jgi:hypothetical protein
MRKVQFGIDESSIEVKNDELVMRHYLFLSSG